MGQEVVFLPRQCCQCQQPEHPSLFPYCGFGGGWLGLDGAAQAAALLLPPALQSKFCSKPSSSWCRTSQHIAPSAASSAQADLKDLADTRFPKKSTPSLRLYPQDCPHCSTTHFPKGRCPCCFPPFAQHRPWRQRALAAPQDVFHLDIIFRGGGNKICLLDNQEKKKKKRLFPWEKFCFV